MRTKYFSPLFGLAAMAMGFSGSDYSHAITNNTSDDIYSDSLYIQRSSAEVPTSFESSGRGSVTQDDEVSDPGTAKVLESLSELDEEAPVKKVANAKKKKSSQN